MNMFIVMNWFVIIQYLLVAVHLLNFKTPTPSGASFGSTPWVLTPPSPTHRGHRSGWGRFLAILMVSPSKLPCIASMLKLNAKSSLNDSYPHVEFQLVIWSHANLCGIYFLHDTNMKTQLIKKNKKDHWNSIYCILISLVKDLKPLLNMLISLRLRMYKKDLLNELVSNHQPQVVGTFSGEPTAMIRGSGVIKLITTQKISLLKENPSTFKIS